MSGKRTQQSHLQFPGDRIFSGNRPCTARHACRRRGNSTQILFRCARKEIPKPSELAKRGGCWFESGSVQIHLGVEDAFRPAKKAHPALRCSDYDGLVPKLRASGIRVDEHDIPGVRRCHIYDPFGNRMELIAGC